MKRNTFTLAQVKEKYGGNYIPYQVLLDTQEWKRKRDEIIRRDNGRCTKCKTKPTDSFWFSGKMHHLLYIPRDPNEVVRIGNYEFLGKELGDITVSMSSRIVLHVHHLYYVQSRMPWEYKDKALITLCDTCHLEVHKKETTPVYRTSNKDSIILDIKVCDRCNGAGYFPQYKHVEAGTCFKCNGTRYTNLTL